MVKKIITVVALLLLITSIGQAQKNHRKGKEVTVHLKDGSVISGRLNAWEYGKMVVIVSEGALLRFPSEEVMKVVEISEPVKSKKPAIIHQTEGWYYNVKAEVMAGNEGGRAHHRVGWGVTGSAGYLWNAFFMTGIGTGYREFIWDSGEEVIPIFVEMAGFLGNQAVRPYYNVQMGYSFAYPNEGAGLLDARGGLSIYPSFGISFGRGKLRKTLDLGYDIQKATYEYRTFGGDQERSVQNLTFKRLSLRLGVSF